jgi:hypothetical protein
VLDDELVFDTLNDANTEWLQHTTQIMQCSLGRAEALLGREELFTEHTMFGRQDTAGSLKLSYINWDIREGRSRVVHYERGCGMCATRGDAVNNVFTAVTELEILPDSTATLPSMHRFGSGAAAMAEQTPGRLLQNIMSKTLDFAFPQYDTLPYDD